MPDNDTPGGFDFDKRVRQYITLRDLIADKQAAFDADIKHLKEMRNALGSLMLGYLRQTKQESARTDAGTVTISNKLSATVEDPAAFRKFCIEQDWTLADLRANANRVEEWINEHQGAIPPGVKFSTFATVGVRRS